ncbi:DUF1566 domain-containing protein [Vibrio cholerae]|nr:DUF1566 domain-containing protein [Vibrio cholerae]EJL6666225.1 DUF1566 domain-containing protein [Vibrio cholerae]
MKIKQALWLVTVFCASISIAQANNCSKENWAPDSRYTIKNDIVVDNETGLEWKRCPEGLNWNGSACTGVPLEISWNDAIKKYASLGRDWRLPTFQELATLRTRGTSDPRVLQSSNCNKPAINQLVFPGGAAMGAFWSSSEKENDNGVSAWFVVFTEGLLHTYYKKAAANIRLVRSIGQAEYIDNNDGTVSDKRTNLTWARCSVGQNWDGQTCSGTATEFNSDDLISVINSANGIVTGTREVGKPFWRLPTVDELETLVFCSKGYEYKTLPSGKYVAQQSCFKEYSQPRIDLTAFPNTPKVNSDYWTSSVNSVESEKIGIVGFESGLTIYQKPHSYSDNYVRLVLDKSTSVYEVNADGTVYDKATNLTWMRCSLGQTWDGKSCIGEAQKYTWDESIKITLNFAGSNAWRLPTVEELDSLVYCSKGRKPSWGPGHKYTRDTNGQCVGDNYQLPTIDISAFPNTPVHYYWSSSLLSRNSPNAFIFDFGNGGALGGEKLIFLPVRLVRVGSNPSTPKPALSSSEQKQPTATVNKYVVNPNGTVYDKETNLTWMRCSLGQTWDGKTCTGEAKSASWNYAMLMHSSDGPEAWRLPTIEELESIVYCSEGRKLSARPEGRYVRDTNGKCLGDNYQRPTIDLFVFPNTPLEGYWSSSPYARGSADVWSVGFHFGGIFTTEQFKSNNIRLVRTGPNSSLKLNSYQQTQTKKEYVVNPNGTVYDKKSNLTWMRCSIGQAWDGQTCQGEAQTFTWDDSMQLKHNFASSNAWRLPTVEELDSLVYCSKGRKESARPKGRFLADADGECHGDDYQRPTIDISAFPNVSKSARYWSSSPYAYDSHYAWHVTFFDGSVRYNDSKNSLNHVRLVRSGQ